jgi:N-acetylneuraminate synthase
MYQRTLIIAEAGVNHDGDVEKALALVDAAAAAKADIVKFQTFKADRLVSRHAAKAAYQQRTTDAAESQYAMLKRLELSDAALDRIIEHAAKRGIEFLSTPFDVESLAELERRGLRRLKLGSGELTNAPLLVAAGRTGLPVILSTGMGTLAEVEQALAALAVGYLGSAPGRNTFAAVLQKPEAWPRLTSKVTLLQCTTQYPAPPADANLAAMDTMRAAFGLAVGYSDHCMGTAVSIAAVARGATVIEKHFTLDSHAPGPDHAASLEPATLAAFVAMIREVEEARGDGRKLPRASEVANIAIARKSVVAATTIRAGETFTDDNIATKRPADGRSPFDYYELLGKPAQRAYATDDPV